MPFEQTRNEANIQRWLNEFSLSPALTLEANYVGRTRAILPPKMHNPRSFLRAQVSRTL
jgi:hypothetical protein